ncbi:MAG: mechanosensitive ion channel family protein [Chloroflexi bacterium]|nr:mechanosensitive ion channel family protein [Chloroflexota bacterium]
MDFDAFGRNSGEDWIAAALIAAGVFIGLLALRWVLVRVTERGPQVGAATPLRGFAAAIERRTHEVVILIVALFAGSLAIEAPRELDQAARAITIVALLIQGGLWGSAAITFAARWQREHDPDLAAPGVTEAGRFIGTLALWSVLVILALDNLGVEVTALIAGLGIGGIAIALATQSILGDLFASLAIVLDRPFTVGDFVAVGEMSGSVERIGVKTTHLRSLSGEQLVIGNSDLLNSRIRNYGRMDERRVVLTLGVTYDATIEQIEAIPGMIAEAIEQQPTARFDRAHFRRFGESALDFEVVYHMLTAEYAVYMDTQQAINVELLRRLREAGVDLAFPTRTVYVHGQPEPSAD